MEEKDIKAKLTPEEYHVLREKGTEPPGSGEHYHQSADGTYTCKVCDAPLFESGTKFDSGTGWPSFDRAIEGSVTLKEDNSLFMRRTEAVCSTCESHLGHMFTDGPRETTGERYCINSLSLNFDEKNDE